MHNNDTLVTYDLAVAAWLLANDITLQATFFDGGLTRFAFSDEDGRATELLEEFRDGAPTLPARAAFSAYRTIQYHVKRARAGGAA